MPIWKRSKKNQGPKARTRRQGALSRLEEQLKSGKTRDFTGDNLSEPQRKRVAKEIAILKERV